MNNIRKSLLICAVTGLLLTTSGWLSAQTFTPTPPNPDAGLSINPPPFDFNDNFYTANGIQVSALNTARAGRFGTFRQTGPPAGPGQLNWVPGTTTDPDRRNVRILATTGGYIDDGTGAGTQFISLIAFMFDQTFFIPRDPNARGINMVNIIGDFEAYAAIKQQKPDGTFFTRPCLASIGQTTNCFSVA